jgi:hypothetical protein
MTIAATGRTDPTMALVDRLAGAALVLAALAAAAGLVVPDLYRDSDAWVRQARAADLVTVLAVLPTLAFGLWRAQAGSEAGRLAVFAALGYLAYNYAIFGFSVVINPMTPVHIAILGLAVWGLVLGAVAVARRPLGPGAGERLPRRTTGGFLLAVPALFALMWLGQIAASIASGVPPAALGAAGLPTNPVYTLDLAFALPFLALAGATLATRSAMGPPLALTATGWTALMGLGILAIFGFDAAAGAPVDGSVALLIGTITGIAIALTAVGLLPAHHAPVRAAVTG